ncbi:lipid A deacylase LpxR family protein [Parvularcula maris]|uniref:Lipid A deacylase LpxR family protein n=1 Tax=Parvularcula maris TaxID=2965077 RepID=A0A9X2L8C3_9PROT|nr:lipid A deacylase LpxR family protein [Parvularcula maris]MCQ8184843.1 lipid A deacylase LpxR family protein [Parvularcula maris]
MAALAAALPAAAAAQEMVADDPRATWTIAVENDGYFGDDDNYTSGLRIGYLSGNRKSDAFGRFFARRLLRVDPASEGVKLRRGFALAQEIYTPEDLDTPEFLPDQHPYAGYLYGELTSLVERPNRVDLLSVQLGVVGPSALGQEGQDFVHNITGRELAQGWDNQIEDSVGLNLTYDRQRRFFHLGNRNAFGLDCVGNLGLSGGTVKTAARIGGNLRFGENLGTSFGPPRVRPAHAGSGFFVPQDKRSWYIFAGGQVEAVAHNIFLDNSLFRDSGPDVGSNTIVADFQAGTAIQLGRAQIAFTYILRTPEFEEQEGSQRFGAFSIAKRF